MGNWLDLLHGDPLPWLLEDENPAVKHLTLIQLLGRPLDDPDVGDALSEAMRSDPISAILAVQHPEGYWEKPGPGYATKYRGTVWQVIFLDQMGVDAGDERVHKACEYVLSHTQTESGGFGASGEASEGPPPPSRVIHCLNGNLLRALLGFGLLADQRVLRAIDWQARAITGDGFSGYYRSGTCGPGFCCAANDKLPCAWGAVKASLALARVPRDKRPSHVQRGVKECAEFLLSCDPAMADYPRPARDKKPSRSWLKPGFPSGYVTDVLQNLEALCELGYGKDPRLQGAVQWLLSKQDAQGRWKNEYAYNGKTWSDVEKQGQTSKWVTLRACRVLKAVYD